MAQKVTFILEIDEKGIVKGSRKAEKSVRGVDNAVGSTKKQTDRLSGAWKKLGTVVAGVAVGELVRRGLTRAIRKGKEFEQQLADLEAITGISGDSLEILGDQALDVSKRFGTAASDIVEAQKLVASQLAEKIDFGTDQGIEQLKEVTEQSIILQKAAGLDLSTAVNAASTAINQFNLEASESSRIVNTMAAAQKFGAAEVDQQAQAMVDAGVAASSANISFEETSAAIQMLAQTGIRGNRAGTQLRNIFTILTAESEKLKKHGIEPVNFEQQTFAEGLRQLKPLLEDDAAMLDVFQRRNLNAAKSLIASAEQTGEFAEKITDTNIASEQANIQMQTFEGSAARLATTFDSELISAFQETNGAMVKMIDLTASLITRFAGGIRQINQWVESNSDLRREMDNTVAAVQAQIDVAQQNIKETKQWIEANDAQGEQLKKANGFIDQQREKIEDLNGQFSAWEESLKSQIEPLKQVIKENQNYRNTQTKQGEALREAEEKLEILQIKLQAARQAQQAYGDATKSAADQQARQNELNEESEAGQSTLAKRLKQVKGEMVEILNRDRDLTTEEKLRLQTLARIQARLEQIRQTRKQIIDEEKERTGVQSGLGVSADQFSQERQAARQKQIEAQATDDLKNKTVELTEAQRERARIARGGSENATKAKQGELSMTEQIAQAAFTAASASVSRGESVGETIRGILKALLAEVVALQVRNVLASVPFPLNVAIAGAAAAGAQALFDAAVPEFLTGGMPQGSIGESGMTTSGKKLISINEDARPEFIVNAESTRRALPLLEAINQSPELASQLSGAARGFQQGGQVNSGGGVDTDAIASAVQRGIQGANIVAQVSIARIARELAKHNERQERIGN